MKILLDYLKDRKFYIVSFFTIMTFIVLVSFFDRKSRLLDTNILYIILVSVIIFIIFVLIDYFIHYRYLFSLKNIFEKKDRDWGDKLPAPPDSIEKYYHDLFKRLYIEKIDEIEKHRLKKNEDLEFITSWIHQIKNPISASKLIIENNTNKDCKEVLYSVEEEIDNIDNYVQKFLYYSRLHDFSQDYLIEDINLNELIKERVKNFSNLFISKKIELKILDINRIVKNDKKSLGFIIDQLLSNALKYTSKNGVITIDFKDLKNEAMLIIKDTGTGIKKEDLARVFKKTFTGSAGRFLHSSTGFGLYLSNKLANKMDIRLEINSIYKHGTSAIIYFPKNTTYYNISKL